VSTTLTCIAEAATHGSQTIHCTVPAQGLTTLAQVGIAVGSVVLGAGLTASVGWVRSWLGFRRRMKSLVHEIETLAHEADVRSHPPPGGGLVQKAPFPTTVWQQVVAAGDLARLDSTAAGALSDFYRAVETANYLAGQVPTFMQTANLSRDPDVQEAFEKEAARFSTEPFVPVAAAADTARGAAKRYST
jgi:hypothetical protein